MDLSRITTYQAGVIQAAAHRKLQKITDALLVPYGLSKMQWFIVGTVLDAGSRGVKLRDLAEQLGTTMSYLTTAVNLLESRGILARNDDTEDTRSKYIIVTDHYQVTCRQIERTLRDGLRTTLYAQVDPAEFRIYMKVMNELGDLESGN